MPPHLAPPPANNYSCMQPCKQATLTFQLNGRQSSFSPETGFQRDWELVSLWVEESNAHQPVSHMRPLTSVFQHLSPECSFLFQSSYRAFFQPACLWFWVVDILSFSCSFEIVMHGSNLGVFTYTAILDPSCYLLMNLYFPYEQRKPALSHPVLNTWHCITKKSFPFFLIICSYYCELLEYYFIQWVCSLLLPVASNMYFGVHCPVVSSFFESFLTLDTVKCSRFILPQTWNWLFLQETLFFSMGCLKQRSIIFQNPRPYHFLAELI
uniref:Uncharacterized protein n=1 Tax=Pipistrellus kuhlii TaxID=59472 RepID=A0A7J7WDF0_PIPKU|nr:hypothetical protein mPipKuh1_008049 [Pipistrellus kuhlii]